MQDVGERTTTLTHAHACSDPNRWGKSNTHFFAKLLSSTSLRSPLLYAICTHAAGGVKQQVKATSCYFQCRAASQRKRAISPREVPEAFTCEQRPKYLVYVYVNALCVCVSVCGSSKGKLISRGVDRQTLIKGARCQPTKNKGSC